MQTQFDDNATEMTWKKLAHANRMVPVPFKLALNGSDVPLYCDEIIRVMPQKRIVAMGRWGDHLVVAKLFFERSSAKRHVQREAVGIKALSECRIPTPKLLYQGSADGGRIQVL